jgi:hypothetical protein
MAWAAFRLAAKATLAALEIEIVQMNEFCGRSL